MKFTKLQQSIVQADKPITICANSRAVGATTGLLLKALTSKENITFFSPTGQMKNQLTHQFESLLREEDIHYIHKTSYHEYYVSDGIYRKKISFKVAYREEELWMKKNLKENLVGTIIVDQVDMFEKDFIEFLRDTQERLGNLTRLVFSTQPIHCGWRNPKYEYGELVEGEYLGKSWDCELVNWKNNLQLKAKPWDYKPNVEVITGYGVEDNPSLDEGFYKAIDNLSDSDIKTYFGEWKF